MIDGRIVSLVSVNKHIEENIEEHDVPLNSTYFENAEYAIHMGRELAYATQGP